MFDAKPGLFADRAPADRTPRDVAVVDVGSNSVRLVLYRVEGRAIWPVYNEKVLAGLGRTVAQTGCLSPEGVKAAMAALRRFRAVLEAARPAQVFAVATAAVREAADGEAFIARVRLETRLKVRVLSGEDEARFSALGVIAGQPDAEGVVGDLGGSSLELIHIGPKARAPDGVTLPLGPFALGAPGEIDPVAVHARLAERLAPLDQRFRSRCFYAVGGAWRNIALIHMDAIGYPLRILHQYEMTAGEALSCARRVAAESKASLERIAGVSKKRAETLPYAAMVLEGLVQHLGLERICISAFGLREGLILDAMPKAVRRLDPLVEGCAALAARQGVTERLGPALQAWLEPFWAAQPPLFPNGRDAVLLAAACRLADLGARLHPDHRANLAFDQVLRAPIVGQNHPERAFLAAATFSRYTSAALMREGSGMEGVLSPERLRGARALGAALRLGCDLSGRTAELLAGCSLMLDKGVVVLAVQRASADLVLGEQTRKRLSTLAGVLQLDCKVRTV